jgi:glycosyltransferase involved in cell wall biosynthesis
MHAQNITPCLSVVMPCYNEERTIRECIEAVLSSSWVGQLVIVDDGSTDKTRAILKAISSDRVKVIMQEKNGGKGSALRTGFQAATQEYVVVQDADLEYDPSEYGRLLAPLLENKADVVFGSRFKGSDAHRVLYYWHSVGNKFLTQISNMFTNLNLTDMETCYKCFRREVVQSIDLKENRFGIEPELTGKIASGKWRLYEVGISYSGRTYEEGKKIGWKDGLRAVYCIIKYSPMFEIRRMKKLTKS